MLGNVISSSEDEIFTTVDLLEADMVRGKITFIKAGASPSWIIRNRRAYRITSKTMPCGIIRGERAEQTILDCFPDDIIIMASDGGECAVEDVIKEIISDKRSFSPKEIVLCLADVAMEKNKRCDDVTFCAVHIL
jgi:stage II sporulation protein E